MSFTCLRFINELASQSGGNAIGRPELTLPVSLCMEAGFHLTGIDCCVSFHTSLGLGGTQNTEHGS